MVEQAFDDQCTGANPRYPLMSELKQMYLNAYYGKHFVEKAMPTADDIKVFADDKVKSAYRKGKKA
jgi:acetaldehyde dehydrogenase/alcohol dehydrogenase